MGQQFLDELKNLQTNFMNMGISVSEQIYQSTKSFIDHDKHLAQSVIDADRDVNENEVDLEKQALYLMALQQPVATNFREIISILKASSDLERIGDHATGIARETIYIKGNQRVEEVETMIAKLTNQVRKMLEEALDAYFHEDASIAEQVAEADKQIDQQYVAIRQAITLASNQATSVAAASASYLMVARYLERIGDHIVNISEWIVYSKTGHIVELGDDQKRATDTENTPH